MQRGLTILLGLLLSTLVFSCAPKMKLTAIKPAEVSMPGVRTLAILPFRGQYGDLVRDEFYSKLDDVKHFTLQDLRYNEALDKIQWEQMDDPRFMPAFAEIKADAAIAGQVIHQIKDIRGADQVKMQEGTGQYRKVKRKNIFTGKNEWVEEEIMRTVLKPVPYIVRTASLTASIKVFDLKTRKILATKQVTESFKQKYGGKEGNDSLSCLFGAKTIEDLPTPEETLSSLAEKVATRLVAKIAPTKYTMEVALDTGGSSDVSKGVKLAKKGDWEGAMEMWQMALEKDPYSGPALYNMGVAYEARGDLNSLIQARNYYLKAIKANSKDMYIEAKVRINKKIRDMQKLEQQQRLLNQTPERKSTSGEVQVY